jgi:hypothetical protein
MHSTFLKKILKSVGFLATLAILAVVVMTALLPGMDRWGATDDEIAASFSGDELVPSQSLIYNRTVTVHAAPEEIYPLIKEFGD